MQKDTPNKILEVEGMACCRDQYLK